MANSGEGDVSHTDVDKRTKYEEEVRKGSHGAVQSCILKFYSTSRLSHTVWTTKLVKLARRMKRFLNPVNSFYISVLGRIHLKQTCSQLNQVATA